jgi:hypothetical protein
MNIANNPIWAAPHDNMRKTGVFTGTRGLNSCQTNGNSSPETFNPLSPVPPSLSPEQFLVANWTDELLRRVQQFGPLWPNSNAPVLTEKLTRQSGQSGKSKGIEL